VQDYIIDSVAEAYVDLGFETSDTSGIKMMAIILNDLNILDDGDMRLPPWFSKPPLSTI